MIMTTFKASAADIGELFHGNGFALAPMGIAEVDGFDGTLTLADEEEREGDGATVLWITDDGYAVAVYDGGEPVEARGARDLADALEIYEAMTLEHGTSATRVTM